MGFEDLNHLVEKALLGVTVSHGGTAGQLRVRSAIRGMLLVIAHHGSPERVMNSLVNQMSSFLDVDEFRFVQRAKFVFAAPMAQYCRNDEPPAPEGWNGFHGAFRRWFRARLISFSKRNTHLFASWLQAKRSCEPLSQQYVRERAYPDHRQAMLTADPLAGSGTRQRAKFFDVLTPVLDRIRRSIERESESTIRLIDHKASQSASLEASRDDGGQAGHLRDLFAPNEFLKVFSTQVETMDWHPRVELSHPAISRIAGVDVFHKRTFVGDRVSVKRVGANYHHFVRDLRSRAISSVQERLQATAYAVLEPLKVRMITKGPSVPYFFAKGLQKVLHSAMRRIPAFRLIGRPVSPTDVLDIIPESPLNLGWISGDYKASTDNVSGLMGMMILDYIIQDLDDDDISVYRAVFGPHEVLYPADRRLEKKAERGRISPGEYEAYLSTLKATQTNGQLMGSPLSFPILCLLNLSLYLNVRKQFAQEIESEFDLRTSMDTVLINGDDILFAGTNREFDIFVELGTELGLTTSVGKTYYHREYANINSTSFMCRLDQRTFCREIEYLNTGLYYGQNKVLSRDDEDERQRDLVSTINRVVSGALPGQACRTLKNFLGLHREEINAVARGRNLFIHESLGGLGVRRPAGFAFRVSDEQRARALIMYRSRSRPVPAARPRNFGENTDVQEYVEPWDTVVPKDFDLRRIPNRLSKQHAWLMRRSLPDWLLEIGIVESS